MVKDGYAERDLASNENCPNGHLLQCLQVKAKSQELGIWKQNNADNQ
ncbi:MAG: hypothetical protein ACFB0E_20905 [Leptolyngbyaceae cyanobacterium]